MVCKVKREHPVICVIACKSDISWIKQFICCLVHFTEPPLFDAIKIYVLCSHGFCDMSYYEVPGKSFLRWTRLELLDSSTAVFQRRSSQRLTTTCGVVRMIEGLLHAPLPYLAGSKQKSRQVTVYIQMSSDAQTMSLYNLSSPISRASRSENKVNTITTSTRCPRCPLFSNLDFCYPF